MLKKNNLSRLHQTPLKQSMGSQTEDFLLYLGMEQKLECVYEEYRHLQLKYQQAQKLIDFLKYKNKYLETSLCQMSIAFNQSVKSNNSHHIEEIRNLDKIISKESKQLHIFNHHHQKDTYLSLSDHSKKTENYMTASKNSSENLKSKSIQRPEQTLNDRKLSAIQESNIAQKSESSFHESQNEFLPKMPESAILVQIQHQMNKCESERYDKRPKASQNHKYATSRINGRKKSTQNNKNVQKVDKENVIYEKLIKIEAQLKMKEFMQKFQMNSRLRKPLQSNLTDRLIQQIQSIDFGSQNEIQIQSILQKSR